MKQFSWLIYILPLLLFASVDVNGQVNLDSAYNEQVQEYDYSDEQYVPEEESEPRQQPNLEIVAFWMKILKTLVIIALIALVFFLIWRYQRRSDNKSVESLKTATNVEEAEQDLLNVSLDALIAEAEKSTDFRLLVHLQFLELLRSLHQKNRIAWTPYKTNGQYLLEIDEDHVRTEYAHIVVIFDRVWYGHKPIDQTGYNAWNDRVNRLKSS